MTERFVSALDAEDQPLCSLLVGYAEDWATRDPMPMGIALDWSPEPVEREPWPPSAEWKPQPAAPVEPAAPYPRRRGGQPGLRSDGLPFAIRNGYRGQTVKVATLVSDTGATTQAVSVALNRLHGIGLARRVSHGTWEFQP